MPASKFNWDKVGIDISKVRGGKTDCPQCHATRKNKKDKSLYINLDNGVYRCFNHPCDFKGCVADRPEFKSKREYEKPVPRLQKISDKAVAWFEKRKISNNTLLRMKIGESNEFMPQVSKERNCICFNYFQDDDLVNIKFRDAEKNFKMVKNAKLIPYNIDAAKDEKEIIWVEGEIDALSCIECGIFNVLSVPNGASGNSSRLDYIDNVWQDLDHIEKHIIAVDDDEAGRLLKDALSFRLGIDKCFFIAYPVDKIVFDEKTNENRSCKDLNEVLIYFNQDKVKSTIKSAEQIPIEGVIRLMDVIDDIVDIFKNGRKKGEPTHYPDLDRIFKWKKGEINLWIGYGNFGKSQFVLHLMIIKCMYELWKWVVFCPENYPAADFYIDLMEMYSGKHIDDRMGYKMSDDEFSAAAEFIDSHIIFVYPELSKGHSLKTINALFKRLIIQYGVDGALIDPWNQLDHEIDQRDDHYLSMALKEIKQFALHNNVSYNIIAHPRNVIPDKEGKRPEIEVWHIAGGAMWNNKSDNIISVDRPKWHDDKTSTLTKVRTHKIKRRRTGGIVGGDAEFNYLVSQSRYCELHSDKIICDPHRAALYREDKLPMEPAKQTVIPLPIIKAPINGFKAYKDDEGAEINF